MSRLLERLEQGPVICAEGYLFEFERRGYLQAGAFVPEVVLEHPELVAQLHREFVHAGSDVVEAFTYYAHREKLRLIGKEDALEEINRQALQIAAEVAREKTASYGIVTPGARDGNRTEVLGLVEKPAPDVAPSTLGVIGRYILQPEIFDILSAHETGAGGEIQLTDAMIRLMGQQPFHGLRYEGRTYDTGNKLGFLMANVAYALEREELAGPFRAELEAYLGR